MLTSKTASIVENLVTDGDPKGTRYGCFLSDLTGFARPPPATSLGGLWDKE